MCAIRIWVGAALAAATAVDATAAAGQTVVYPVIAPEVFEWQCLTSRQPPEVEVDVARNPAIAAMRTYWQRTLASDAANIERLFQRRGRTEWVHDGQTHRRNRLRAINDPLARRPGHTMRPEPIAFVIGHFRKSGHGVWAVTAADGSIAGYYLVEIQREWGEWLLARIELLPASAPVPELRHYCNVPGDIELLRTVWQERAARRAAREQARARSNDDSDGEGARRDDR